MAYIRVPQGTQFNDDDGRPAAGALLAFGEGRDILRIAAKIDHAGGRASGLRRTMRRARGRKIKATFSDGTVSYTTSERGFTHAWRVTGIDANGKATGLSGWARSEALAHQAATAHVGPAATRWSKVKAEVVEIEPIEK